ncbi:MAG: hypothetical protein WD960_16005 [Gemmatimonadota bacterium]
MTRLTRILALLLAPVIASACGAREAPSDPSATPAAQEQDSQEAGAVEAEGPRLRPGFRPPQELAASGFRLAGGEALEDGTHLLRYFGPERPQVDVFITPVFRPGEEPGDSARQEMVSGRFEAELAALAEYYAGIDDRTIDVGGEPREIPLASLTGPRFGLHQRLSVVLDDGTPYDSHLALVMIDGLLVKLRATFEEEHRERGEPHIHALFEEFAAEFSVGIPVDPG